MLAIPLQNLPLLWLTWKIIVRKCMGGFWLFWFTTSFDALCRWKRVLHAWGSPVTNSHRARSEIVHTANPTIIRTIYDTMMWLLHQTRQHFIIILRCLRSTWVVSWCTPCIGSTWVSSGSFFGHATLIRGCWWFQPYLVTFPSPMMKMGGFEATSSLGWLAYPIQPWTSPCGRPFLRRTMPAVWHHLTGENTTGLPTRSTGNPHRRSSSQRWLKIATRLLEVS